MLVLERVLLGVDISLQVFAEVFVFVVFELLELEQGVLVFFLFFFPELLLAQVLLGVDISLPVFPL